MKWRYYLKLLDIKHVLEDNNSFKAKAGGRGQVRSPVKQPAQYKFTIIANKTYLSKQLTERSLMPLSGKHKQSGTEKQVRIPDRGAEINQAVFR